MPDIVESIAHITDGDQRFQVLNATGDDWDEDATRAQYEAWKSAQGKA